jgi:tRNA/rRNA methyltransferase
LSEPAAGMPAIVLVRPQLGENIGAVARAMLNFGLLDLRLVSPRDGWPNPDAGPAASGADVVLERARLFGSLSDAVADCHYVYATTVRPRGLTKPVVTPAFAAQEIVGRADRSAVVFGPERSGLETDDVAVADAILTVPVNRAFASLNLAQAVVLVSYEWFQKSHAPESVKIVNFEGPAARQSLDGLIAQVDAALVAADYYRVPSRVASARRTLRNLLTRPGWSEQEVRTMRGIVHALVNGRRGARPRNQDSA